MFSKTLRKLTTHLKRKHFLFYPFSLGFIKTQGNNLGSFVLNPCLFNKFLHAHIILFGIKKKKPAPSSSC